MSKQRTSVLLSLCIAFALAIYGFVAAMTYAVKAESVDASVSPADRCRYAGQRRRGCKSNFCHQQNLGTRVFYRFRSGGGHLHHGGRNAHRFGRDVLFRYEGGPAAHSDLFAEDSVSDGAVQYAEGDTISFTTDFSFSNEDGSKTFTLGEAVTVTYTGGEWDGQLCRRCDLCVGCHRQSQRSGIFCLAVAFSLISAIAMYRRGTRFLTLGSGWLPQGSIGGNLANMYDNHIMFTSFGRMGRDEICLAQCTVAIGDASSHASSGSILTLKAGNGYIPGDRNERRHQR